MLPDGRGSQGLGPHRKHPLLGVERQNTISSCDLKLLENMVCKVQGAFTYISCKVLTLSLAIEQDSYVKCQEIICTYTVYILIITKRATSTESTLFCMKQAVNSFEKMIQSSAREGIKCR